MRYQGKHFGLTYSQANELSLERLYESLLKLRGVEYLLVSEELHKDGNRHYHCQLLFKRRKDVKSTAYFDISDKHPNIQLLRQPEVWNSYCKKDGKFLENKPWEGTGEYDLFDSARRDGYEDFITKAIENKILPAYATIAWNHTHSCDNTIEEDTEIKGHYNELLNWYEAPIELKSTVIVGESGIGKTVYAKRKASKPALFISHLDDLRKFDPIRHRSIIFDDMSFTHMPTTGQIHLVDLFEPRSIHVRYGTANIPAGTERWFTCNKFPFEEHPAIMRRINKINLY